MMQQLLYGEVKCIVLSTRKFDLKRSDKSQITAHQLPPIHQKPTIDSQILNQ